MSYFLSSAKQEQSDGSPAHRPCHSPNGCLSSLPLTLFSQCAICCLVRQKYECSDAILCLSLRLVANQCKSCPIERVSIRKSTRGAFRSYRPHHMNHLESFFLNLVLVQHS